MTERLIPRFEFTAAVFAGCSLLFAVKTASGGATTHDSLLRLARSPDGLRFEANDKVVIRGAAAPTILEQPNGRLLLVFDHANDSSPGGTRLAVTTSPDSGRTWNDPTFIEVRAPRGRLTNLRHAHLVLDTDGRIRLFFAADLVSQKIRARPNDDAPNRRTVIVSALGTDGIHYRLDRSTIVRVGFTDDPHPIAVRVQDTALLFVDSLTAPGETALPLEERARGEEALYNAHRHEPSPAPVQDHPRLASALGELTFQKWRTIPRKSWRFVGSIIPIGRTLRAYVTSPDGIRTLTSRNGRDWNVEDGALITNAWDPAVTKLRDGSFLMAYCAPIDSEPILEQELLLAAAQTSPPDGIIADASSDWPTDPDELPIDDDDEYEADFVLDGHLPSESSVAKLLSDPNDENPPDSVENPINLFQTPAVDFAPAPNDDEPVDYLGWFLDNVVAESMTNVEMGPHPLADPVNWEDVPEFVNMFEDENFIGPPQPWQPWAHPEWERSNITARQFLDWYREAGRIPDYKTPMQFDEKSPPIGGRHMLWELIIPPIGKQRDLANAILAGAWRIEKGRVSSTRMLDAWEAVLRNADHLGHGTTLIEKLVGMAMRRKVHENARWALAQDVFSADELESALDTLQRWDRENPETADWVRGEHAMTMDAAQRLFEPLEPGGEPHFHADVAEAIRDASGGTDEQVERLRNMATEEVRAAMRTIDEAYRELGDMVRQGYPTVRAADLDNHFEKRLPGNPLVEMLAPSFSRAHALSARAETSRRATQLTYAVHLHRQRTGHWPASLEDVDLGPDSRIRIDPFTGRNFGYRLDPDGPTIYSLSENARDDGGIHSPKWNDALTDPAASDDHVFWPPQP